MTLIAHISDPHFGTEQPAVCSALQADLFRHAPDLVVLTGDITQRARAPQFRAARRFLDELAPLKIITLPGNHDLPLFDLITRFTNPYRLYRAHICPELTSEWSNAELAVIAINSTRPTRHQDGELPASLIRDVSNWLSTCRQTFKVVALHHPLAVTKAIDEHNIAHGALKALAEWTEAGADLFLGGHIHLPFCIPVGASPNQALVLQAGTALSQRIRGGQPNSYNLIRLSGGTAQTIEVEQRDFDATAAAFHSRISWHAARHSGGWTLSDPEQMTWLPP